MRESFDESQVERAYGAVGACLDRVEEHFQRCVRLLCNQEGVPPKGPTVSDEGLRELTDGLAWLGETTERTRDVVKPLERELPGLATEPVRSQSIVASSWAEAVVMHADNYLRDLADWDRFRQLKPARQCGLVDAMTRDMPNVPLFRASLKIECARLVERARRMGPEARYPRELQELRGQSARFFRLLIEKRGHWVEYQRIAREVCDDPSILNEHIHKAMNRLKVDLRKIDSRELVDAIESQAGAYRLR